MRPGKLLSKNNMKKHLELNFHGNLKGLGVMQFAQDNARRLNIDGYVKRLPTGTIHVEAEGEERDLEAFIVLCREREDWREENDGEVNITDKLIGYSKFYIRKQG